MTAPSPEDTPELKRMSWGAHFRALRKTLMWCVIALALGTVISFGFLKELWAFLLSPLPPSVGGATFLHNLRPTDPLLADFKVALWAGSLLASPILFWQVWAFLAPALFEGQRKIILSQVGYSILFMAAGSSFAFWVVIPLCLKFFLGYNSGISTPTWTQDSYLDFVLNFLLTFAFVFQMPVAAQLLARFGLLKSEFLIAQWRIAVLLIFVVAALLSPPDVLSQVLLAVPMMALFGISIVWTRWVEKNIQPAAES